MRIARLTIKNFRGVRDGLLLLPEHAVLVGDNNIGKSTVLEAIDLVLGPERLARRPVIDEHDFHTGRYMDAGGNCVSIAVEVVVADLGEEQQRHFRDHLEWWDTNAKSLLQGPPAEGTDAPHVKAALRVVFEGAYDKEEDDFAGDTFFASPAKEDGTRDTFRAADKRVCGFLFLRTLRTGSRALSLERGSLLDIILRLQEKQLRMWEEVLAQLRVMPVAEKKEIGITDVLANVQDALRRFVPSDWASNPHMRVSDLTRETLRKTLTVFMGTGSTGENGSEYAAPFQHQGTGTINALVLALLSMIAELRQNVIFAMEEPEIAIPPHAQKAIIESVRGKSAQALFTSHSPYVLEEFPPEQVLVMRRENATLTATPASLPPAVKPKKYKEEFRRRFCEGLLARRVLITEGRTEYDAFPAVARHLHALNPTDFSSLESLGIAVVSADSDSQVAPLGEHFKNLGKTVFAVFDKQVPAQKAAIEAAVPHAYEGPEKGFEKMLLDGVAEPALRRYAEALVADGEWPAHLAASTPTPATPLAELRSALFDCFSKAKGVGTAGDLLCACSEAEMPAYVVDTLRTIKRVIEPAKQQPVANDGASTAAADGPDAVVFATPIDI